jgi:hypothetical protein
MTTSNCLDPRGGEGGCHGIGTGVCVSENPEEAAQWPLGEASRGALQLAIRELGFSRRTIRLHLFSLSHLNEHLNGTTRGVRQGVSSGDIVGFFQTYPAIGSGLFSLHFISRVHDSIKQNPTSL